MTARVILPGVDSSLGNHEERIRALERASAGLPMQAAYYASSFIVSMPDIGGPQAVVMQGGLDVLSSPALTADPDVFGIGTMVGGLFAGIDSIQLKMPGLYGAFISVVNAVETDVSTPKQQSLGINVEGPCSFSESGLNFSGHFSRSVFGHQDVFMLWALGNEGSELIGIDVESLRGGGGTTDAVVYVFVVRFNALNMTDYANLA